MQCVALLSITLSPDTIALIMGCSGYFGKAPGKYLLSEDEAFWVETRSWLLCGTVRLRRERQEDLAFLPCRCAHAPHVSLWLALRPHPSCPPSLHHQVLHLTLGPRHFLPQRGVGGSAERPGTDEELASLSGGDSPAGRLVRGPRRCPLWALTVPLCPGSPGENCSVCRTAPAL